MLERVAGWLKRVIFPVSLILNNSGIWVLVMLALVITADVFGRRLLHRPVTGVMEITSLCMVIIISLTLAHCAASGGHIEMDILTRKISRRVRASIVAVMYALTAVMLGVTSWQLLVLAMRLQSAGQMSGTLQIYISPFIYLATLGCILVTLVYLILSLDSLVEARRK